MISEDKLYSLLEALSGSNVIADANGEDTIDLIKNLLWTCEVTNEETE